MNIQTINLVSESFIQKMDVGNNIEKEKLVSFLLESIREVRQENLELYEELRNLPKYRQYQVLESILAIEFYDFESIVEKTLNVVNFKTFFENFDDDSSLEEIDNQIRKQITENFKNLDNKTELLSESFIQDLFSKKPIDQQMGKAAQAGIDMTQGFGKRIIEYTKKVIKAFWPFLATASAFYVLPFSIAIWAFMGVALYLAGAPNQYQINTGWTQSFWGIINDFCDLLIELANLIKKHGNWVKYRFMVALSNEEQCYKTAGVTKDDINFLDVIFAGKSKELDKSILLTKSGADMMSKLRTCFLQHVVEKISIFFDLYFDCVRKTGNWNKIGTLQDDKLIELFRVKGSSYEMCDEYLVYARKAVNIYEEILDSLFAGDQSERAKWEILLNRFIIDRKDSVWKQKKEGQKSFGNNPKFRETSKDIFK